VEILLRRCSALKIETDSGNSSKKKIFYTIKTRLDKRLLCQFIEAHLQPIAGKAPEKKPTQKKLNLKTNPKK